MHILFRLFMIHVGLICACLAGAGALAMIETWGMQTPPDITEFEAKYAVLINTALLGFMALVVTYVPAVLIGLLTEIFGWRSVLLYAVIGVALGVLPALDLVPSWITVVSSGDELTRSPLKAFPAVGAIAGCAYWLVTGCKAGFAKLPPPLPHSS